MNINCLKNEDVITLELEGRIDVVGAGQLEEAINSHKEQTKKMILDFQNIVYLASAGLRTLNLAQNYFDSVEGRLVLLNVPEIVMEVFEMTGFIDFLEIES